MDLTRFSKKDIGALGERIAAQYLTRQGFKVIDRNAARKTGELDIVATKAGVLHVVEVKTLTCRAFPLATADQYRPEDNLHAYKIRKVTRTAAWYVAASKWKGEWQIDGVLVWLQVPGGAARVRYLPHIL